MAEWEKEIAELKTDVKYIREDVNIMQKQIRDLNKHKDRDWETCLSFDRTVQD